METVTTLHIQENKSILFLNTQEVQHIQTIIIEENIHVTLVEAYDLKEETNLHKKVIVKKNSSVEYIKVDNNQNKATIFFTFELAKKAHCTVHTFCFGNNEQTNHYQALLTQEYSVLEINGLVKLHANSQCNNHFDIVHQGEHTHSNIAFKHALHDQSKALFQAKTVVQNSALYAKAFQNSKTLLLSDDATIFTQPHLEIEVDELQASHGATTGNLNPEELLYLQSRGIEEQEAKNILLKAFENELFDKIQNEQAREYVKQKQRSYYD